MTPMSLLKVVSLIVPFGVLLLGPRDAVLRQMWNRRPIRMWHFETITIMALVSMVVCFSGNDPVEWVGFAALVLAHGRNSVMFRLSEAQARLVKDPALQAHHVECWKWTRYYFLLAESFWATYFVMHRAWAALAGVMVFVGYERWRKWYTAKKQ